MKSKNIKNSIKKQGSFLSKGTQNLTNEQKIDTIYNTVGKLANVVNDMNANMKDMKVDMKEMKVDMKEMKVDMKEMNASMKVMNVDIKDMNSNMKGMNANMADIKAIIVQMKEGIDNLNINFLKTAAGKSIKNNSHSYVSDENRNNQKEEISQHCYSEASYNSKLNSKEDKKGYKVKVVSYRINRIKKENSIDMKNYRYYPGPNFSKERKQKEMRVTESKDIIKKKQLQEGMKKKN